MSGLGGHIQKVVACAHLSAPSGEGRPLLDFLGVSGRCAQAKKMVAYWNFY